MNRCQHEFKRSHELKTFLQKCWGKKEFVYRRHICCYCKAEDWRLISEGPIWTPS